MSRAIFPANRLQITKNVIFLKVSLHETACLELVLNKRIHFGAFHILDLRNTRLGGLPLFLVNILNLWRLYLLTLLHHVFSLFQKYINYLIPKIQFYR